MDEREAAGAVAGEREGGGEGAGVEGEHGAAHCHIKLLRYYVILHLGRRLSTMCHGVDVVVKKISALRRP